MARELTACFVGLGSIGKRHLINLKKTAEDRGIVVSTTIPCLIFADVT